jgi:hypothetical protein
MQVANVMWAWATLASMGIIKIYTVERGLAAAKARAAALEDQFNEVDTLTMIRASELIDQLPGESKIAPSPKVRVAAAASTTRTTTRTTIAEKVERSAGPPMYRPMGEVEAAAVTTGTQHERRSVPTRVSTTIAFASTSAAAAAAPAKNDKISAGPPMYNPTGKAEEAEVATTHPHGKRSILKRVTTMIAAAAAAAAAPNKNVKPPPREVWIEALARARSAPDVGLYTLNAVDP